MEISVIMPVYNVELYIEDSIKSVLAQTFRDFELILVNDGSSDRCSEICDNYAKMDNRIRVIHKRNGGMSSARNSGIDMARGKYLYMIDSDDTIEPHTLEKAYKSAEKNNADLVVVGVAIHSIVNKREDSIIEKKRPDIVLYRENIGHCFCDMVQNSMYNYPWDKLYKREKIENAHIRYDSFYDRVCEDTVFLYELLPFIDCISTVPEICYHYMIRDSQSVVKKYIPERFEKYMGNLKILQKVAKWYPDEQESFQRLIQQKYINCVQWSIANMFHSNCELNFVGRWRYYCWMLKIDENDNEFRKKALNFMDDSDISRSEKILLYLYVHRRALLMAIITTMLKYR